MIRAAPAVANGLNGARRPARSGPVIEQFSRISAVIGVRSGVLVAGPNTRVSTGNNSSSSSRRNVSFARCGQFADVYGLVTLPNWLSVEHVAPGALVISLCARGDRKRSTALVRLAVWAWSASSDSYARLSHLLPPEE